MKRGSKATPSRPKKRSRRSSSRDRALLLGLLVVIAVLLGVLIALLPDDVSSPVETVAAEEGSDPDTDRRPEPAADEPGDIPADADEGTATDEDAPVTESYPEDEPKPVPPVGEPDQEHWWLPGEAAPAEQRGSLVLVLDDAGNSLDAFEVFLEFPGPLSVAVLPLLDYSVQAAAMTASAGKEILLHQPMEAVGGANPGPGAVGPTLSPPEINRQLTENLASVPGVVGVNNHMGSLATTDPEVMHAMLTVLHERGLFFLDSRTSAQTVGRAVAAEVGIPFAERSVFLDNVRTREAILSSLGHALELTDRGEPVIMIGHATVPLLGEILNEVYPLIVERGYRFASLSSLVAPVARAERGEE